MNKTQYLITIVFILGAFSVNRRTGWAITAGVVMHDLFKLTWPS